MRLAIFFLFHPARQGHDADGMGATDAKRRLFVLDVVSAREYEQTAPRRLSVDDPIAGVASRDRALHSDS